jgi:threonine/homoserine/homoserine lactone efflux protein
VLVGLGAARARRGAARLLHSPRRLRAFNIAMALLLVASIIPVLIES